MQIHVVAKESVRLGPEYVHKVVKCGFQARSSRCLARSFWGWSGQFVGDRVGMSFATLRPSLLSFRFLHTSRGWEWISRLDPSEAWVNGEKWWRNWVFKVRPLALARRSGFILAIGGLRTQLINSRRRLKWPTRTPCAGVNRPARSRAARRCFAPPELFCIVQRHLVQPRVGWPQWATAISYKFEVSCRRGAPRQHQSTMSAPTWQLIAITGMMPEYALSQTNPPWSPTHVITQN